MIRLFEMPNEVHVRQAKGRIYTSLHIIYIPVFEISRCSHVIVTKIDSCEHVAFVEGVGWVGRTRNTIHMHRGGDLLVTQKPKQTHIQWVNCFVPKVSLQKPIYHGG
jgi:hypothetical protein